jgi:DNA-binding transcriptional regulator YiaG
MNMTIKELRTAAGMTQQAFSDYFGIPKRTVEDWEGNKAKPAQYLVTLIEYKLRKEGLI